MPRKANPLVLKVCPTCHGVFQCKSYRDRTYCTKRCANNFPAVQEKNRTAVAKLFDMKYGKHPMQLKTVKRSGPPKTSSSNKFTEEIIEFVKTLVPISTNQKALAPLEVDIFIPSKHIAIETVNIQEHSEIKGGKHKNYHLNKTRMASMKGIRLIHVFQNDWVERKPVVKSILRNLLVKKNKVIYGRDCEIYVPASHIKNKFLAENNIHGTDRSNIQVGLVRKDTQEMVAIMTFKNSRFDDNVEWEVSRFCCKLDCTVIGAATKLFSYFIKKYDPKTIAAHVDRRYFSGEVYLNLGFNFIKNNPPTAHYVVKSYDNIESANNWRKDKLNKKVKKFDQSLSEWENMKLNGFDRIWDCGYSKWAWTAKSARK